MTRTQTTKAMADTVTIDQRLLVWAERVEKALDAALPLPDAEPARLHQAMRYSTLNGGKRVRPALIYATGELLGIAPTELDASAAAIEMIHVYSLVHDDLPAMDDDEFRRGRLTCHRQYDEATAILAGDALQVLAFQTLAEGPGSAEQKLAMIQILARASGTAGMAGGQAVDLAAAGRVLTLIELEEMHKAKTGALLQASVLLPAAKAEVDASLRGCLARFGQALGLAFQIVDDLLDIEGDPALLGKATGMDQARGKPTYPAIVGVPAARLKAQELHTLALQELSAFGAQADPLRALAHFLTNRNA